MTDPRFYRAQAEQARADADAAALDNVRDRHLRSAGAFEAMAERYERVAPPVPPGGERGLTCSQGPFV